MKKKILFLLLAVVLVSTLVVSYASAASPLEISKYDVTKTSKGAQIAQETVQRWQGYGWNFDAKSVKVYEINPGDYLVAPVSAKIELESIRQPDGSVRLEAVVVTASPSVSLTKAQGVSPMAAPYWNLVDSNFWTVDNSYGYIDHAYQMNKLVGETDSQKDYYQLYHYATAKSKSIWILTDASLECRKHASSSTMEWFDWSPRSDLPSSQCGTIGLSVSAFGVGISASDTICPTMWDITMYAEAGHFKNKWVGSAWRSEREVSYMICVKVPQGGWPVWTLTAGFSCKL